LHPKEVLAMLATLPAAVETLLASSGDRVTVLGQVLEEIARAFGAQTATLHAADADGTHLLAVADRGIPEAVRAHTRRIPFGKGMAGICAERRAPVTVCNLQTDESGVVRPGAKETGVAGAIVVPVLDAGGARLVGTLGIGKPGEHDYTDEEQRTLTRCAELMSSALQSVAHAARAPTASDARS
jgi:GAF domain-containing protein